MLTLNETVIPACEYHEDNDPELIDSALYVLGKITLSINAANGWNVTTPETWTEAEKDPDRLPCKLALLHEEVSEVLRAYRRRDRANFEEECADVLIRLIDMTAGLGIDLGAVTRAKLAVNRTRGFRHGGKLV